MKWKKGLKQKMATALIVAMTVGMTAGSAWADEAPAKSWVVDEAGNWTYYKSDGEQVIGREKYIRGNWYGFDENGRMYSNELFVSEDQYSEDIIDTGDGNEIEPNRLYAYAAGNLAKGWVKLNGAGELFTNDDSPEDAHWYYFKGGSEDEAPRMIQGTEKEIKGTPYRFYPDGTMYRGEWYFEYRSQTEDFTASDEYAVHYFQSDGPKAVKKWLPIGDIWYHFDGKGEVYEVAPVASSSDMDEAKGCPWQYKVLDQAPARQVHSIDVATPSNIDVELGETVTLKFKVTLASDSNAKEQSFGGFDDFHDFEPGAHLTGRFYVSEAETDQNGICSVKYMPKKLGEETVKLKIDDKISTSAFTVNTVMAKNVGATKDAVDTLIDSIIDDGAPAVDTRSAILEILTESGETDKKTVQNTIADNKNYETLDNNYAMENAIVVKPANVEPTAQNLLRGGEISVVGGALNAENRGAAVELKVAPSAAVPTLKQEFKNKVSFDIKLAIDEEDQTSLDFPVKITMPVPTGLNADSMKLFHIHDGEETEVPFRKSGSGMITFTVTGFSDFVFAQNDTGSGNGGSGGGSSSSSAGGVVTTDSKKGQINSLTGIIIGSGDGYSKWVQETVEGQTAMRWKLQYADGTFAAGGYVLDEQGNPKKDSAGNLIEQPLWELISGAWYAFGADGYAKSGLVFDPSQNGWFYVDINSGMKTGWQQIDGKWYYFNTTSDGSKGIMYVSRNTPDGYEVGADGVWNGQ